jgi:hypothetical protein
MPAHPVPTFTEVGTEQSKFTDGTDSPTPSRLVQAMTQLDWTPEFGLVDGLRDSYQKDFGLGNFRKAADFETDDMIIEKVKGKKVAVMA